MNPSTRRVAVSTKRVVIGAVVVGTVAGVAVYFGMREDGPGTDVLGGRESPPQRPSFLDLTGPPIFSFGSLYLEGRSSWCLRQFREDRVDFVSVEIGDRVDVEVKILREPFTDGKWVAELSEDEARLREETESQAVNVEVTFRVPGVGAVDLLVFILCSRFRVDLPVDAASSYDCLFPGEPIPGDCLDDLPELSGNHMMAREHWPGGFQKKASDIWYLNKVGRDGDAYFYVYEAWKNCPGEGDRVNVKMSTGQYAISERDGDCVVRVRSFYSGQSVPRIPFVGRIVSRRTREFYEGLAATLAEQSPDWEPHERARRWQIGLRF